MAMEVSVVKIAVKALFLRKRDVFPFVGMTQLLCDVEKSALMMPCQALPRSLHYGSHYFYRASPQRDCRFLFSLLNSFCPRTGTFSNLIIARRYPFYQLNRCFIFTKRTNPRAHTSLVSPLVARFFPGELCGAAISTDDA